MAACLDYQSVYSARRSLVISVKAQIAIAVLLLMLLTGKVWIKVQSTQVGYELAAERQRAITQDMERRDLELQLSVLHRPDNLARMARSRLGLVPMQAVQARKIVS